MMSPVLLSFSGDKNTDVFGLSKRVNPYYGADVLKTAQGYVNEASKAVQEGISLISTIKGVFTAKPAAAPAAPAGRITTASMLPGIGGLGIGTIALIGAGLVLSFMLMRK